MRTVLMVFLTVLVAILGGGCNPDVYVYDLYDGWTYDRGPVPMYLEQHPLLSESVALEACEMWSPVGADCEITLSSNAARVKIFVSDDICERDEHGGYFVARATVGPNEILVVEDCLYESYGKDALNHLPRVLAHEIGHILGVDKHIPLDCNDPWDSLSHKDTELPYDEQGKLICGPAIMNRVPYEELPGITVPDYEAHAQRARGTGLSLF